MNPSIKTFPYLNDGNLTLVPLSHSHIEFVRVLRNHYREWFFTQDIITPEQQEAWYERYVQDMTYQFWVAFYRGLPVGTGALAHLDLDRHEGEWSTLMVAREARGQGIGGRICHAVRDYALDTLNLDRIYGALFTDNAVMLHIDIAAGYLPYKVEGDVTFVELWRKDHR